MKRMREDKNIIMEAEEGAVNAAAHAIFSRRLDTASLTEGILRVDNDSILASVSHRRFCSNYPDASSCLVWHHAAVMTIALLHQPAWQ